YRIMAQPMCLGEGSRTTGVTELAEFPRHRGDLRRRPLPARKPLQTSAVEHRQLRDQFRPHTTGRPAGVDKSRDIPVGPGPRPVAAAPKAHDVTSGAAHRARRHPPHSPSPHQTLLTYKIGLPPVTGMMAPET